MNIVLKEDAQTLDEVVVVGYGTTKKVNVIGSKPDDREPHVHTGSFA